MTNYTELHQHSTYSLLDGMALVYDYKTKAKGTLAEKAAQLGMTALALTDHGNTYGHVRHHLACKEVGIKPIFGYEAYVTKYPSVEDQRESKDRQFHHITLLAETDEGLRNLYQLATIANTDGFWHKPLNTPDNLRHYSQGVIALSGCLGGVVPQMLIQGDYDGAEQWAEWYKYHFPGNYYLEVHNHGIPDEEKVRGGIEHLARDLHLPIVAANDGHYLNKEDAKLHDILLQIGTGGNINDPKRFGNWEPEFYLKSVSEMNTLFPSDYVNRTMEVAERCNAKLTGSQGFPRPANMPSDVE